MVFRKYRPLKQWGKMDTRIFKGILKARNNRKMKPFDVPDAVKAAGIEVHNPNSASFFTPIIGSVDPLPDLRASHPAYRVPPVEEHPFYHANRCHLFKGGVPMSDGIAQAAVLSKAVVKEELPETVLHHVHHLEISEEQVKDAILHGERYDPTLEKLPRRFDPVLFWINHPVVYGTPVTRRLNIILNNLTRSALFSGIRSGNVTDYIRLDRDEPINGSLPNIGSYSENPFVLSFQPHITLQGSNPVAPWADRIEVDSTSQQDLPSIAPLSPLIDLELEHIYNESPVLARPDAPVSLHAVLWSREQNQKYPWTKEQNAANAILHTFGAAVAEASRTKRDLRENPVVVKGIQLVDGKLDIVIFQLNTMNLSSEESTKNIVWIDRGCRLYAPKPYYEQLTEVDHVNMQTFKKFVAVLWNKVTLLLFAISALDLLGELDRYLTEDRRKSIIAWIYKLQVSGSGEFFNGEIGFPRFCLLWSTHKLPRLHGFSCTLLNFLRFVYTFFQSLSEVL
ncbi:hypothetical protein DICVIV_02417 [Dictyocaulus viviparus]|uniref:Uncharacterized protein n=1 Tax=Dictyocaulus viviparus TaxID=29172 RepID=A0A0D8Y3G1_DICVI|nr:hypothetical protein DICVIV_02417 [Dictyocaulus viviparus]